MTFRPSKYQTAFFSALTETSHNLLVDAKAGSGKTTTIKMGVELLERGISILVCAFNRSIKAELQESLPSYCTVKTCHALGMAAIKQKYPKTQVENSKYAIIIKKLSENWDIDLKQEDDQLLIENVKKLVNLCRMYLAVTEEAISAVAEKYGMDIVGDEALKTLQCIRMGTRNRHKMIDFTDMVFLPAILPEYLIEKYDFIFIDEAQDLSRAQQDLIFKHVKKGTGRWVAVGDPHQAIYGFAGADSEAFERYRGMAAVTELPLNECYRCGKEIIDFVKTIVPDIVAFEKNPDGKVRDGKVSEPTAGDFVLCRTNLPLVKLCYEFIAEGRAATINGKDVGESLIKWIEKPKISSYEELKKWMDNELLKKQVQLQRNYPYLEMDDLVLRPSYQLMQERISIVQVIQNARDCTQVFQISREIRSLFCGDKKGIILSTIHKSKGLESDKVFIIERDQLPAPWVKKDWEIQQESNLEYVAYTRAKEELIFITDWSYNPSDDDNGTQSELELEPGSDSNKDLPF